MGHGSSQRPELLQALGKQLLDINEQSMAGVPGAPDAHL